MLQTYFYVGKPFSQVSAADPSFSFSTSDFAKATITLDVTPGVAASGLVADSWKISDSFQGSFVGVESSDVAISVDGNTFDVNAAGEITNWSLSAVRPGLSAAITSAGDRALVDQGSPQITSASNGQPGVWSMMPDSNS